MKECVVFMNFQDRGQQPSLHNKLQIGRWSLPVFFDRNDEIYENIRSFRPKKLKTLLVKPI